MNEKVKKGLFVCFEGVDASGKTTLMNKYKKEMEDKGFKVKTFRAIGEGEFGSKLRDIVLNFKEDNRVNPVSEALLFIAAIQDCYYKHIKPWVDEGNIAVTDRWIYSTFVYQTIYQESLSEANKKNLIPYHAIKQLMQFIIKPDFTVLSKVNQTTVLDNLVERNQLNSMDEFCVKQIETMIQYYEIINGHNYLFKGNIFLSIDNNRPYPKPDDQLKPIIDYSLNFHKASGLTIQNL